MPTLNEAEVTTALGTLRLKGTSLEERAAAIQVTDPASHEAATAFVVDVKAAEKAVEDRRDALVRPLNTHVHWINAEFRKLSAPLVRVREAVATKILTYHREQQRKADEEQRRVDAENRRVQEERVKAERAKAAAEAAKRKAELDAELAATPKEAKVAEKAAAVAGKTLEQATQEFNRLDFAPDQQAMVVAPKRTTYVGGGAAQLKEVWDFEVVNAAALPYEYTKPNEVAILKAVREGVRQIPGVRIFPRDQLAITTRR